MQRRRPGRFIDRVPRPRDGRGSRQARDDGIELVEDQPEPELVGLMRDDEQQLVVMDRRRLRMLQRDEIRHAEVIGVGQLRVIAFHE